MINRKQFLTCAAATAAAVLTHSWSYADQTAQAGQEIGVTVHPRRKLRTISPSLIGLSYESALLGDPGMFSADNKSLISLFRSLSDHGVLRLGGNTVEFADWTPGYQTPTQMAAPPSTTTVGHRVHRRTRVTETTIDNLAQFLTATGWSLIYGLNLGTGAPDAVADEVKYVTKAVGDNLLAFQIGNEPDLFRINGLRPTTWRYSDFFAEWIGFADAIQRENPGAPLAGPDVSGGAEWISQFADGARDRIVFFTGHYYAEGPPSSPLATIDTLLRPNPYLDKLVRAQSTVMHNSGLPIRVTEGNTCYNGGKAGVSDTFASALWGANYALEIANAGQAGVNFHGGGNGSYTPIAGSVTTGFTPRPIYYGMLFAQQFAGTSLLTTTIDAPDARVTAYAAHSKHEQLVALFNMDIEVPRSITLATGTKASCARLWPLTAPTIDSTSGISLAGAEVGPDGFWSPQASSIKATSQGRFDVVLPAGSAALLFI